MSEQQLPSTSTFVEAMDDINKSQKLNPKADQLLVDMGIKEDDSLPTCTITQEKINYKDCVKTSCGHYFSCEEFWQWTKQSNKCPNCREELIKRDRSEELALKNLLDRRREIREQVRDAYEELDIIKAQKSEYLKRWNNSIKRREDLVEELKQEEKTLMYTNENMENSINRNREILEEMRLYKTNRSQWEKRMKRRERLAIHRGKDRWRNKMKIVHKELFKKNFSWFEDELAVREEFKPYSDDEVDISELNIFELPPEFAGDETRLSVCTYSKWTKDGNLIGNLRVELEEGEVDEINWDSYEYVNWGDSDSDMSIVDSDNNNLPELIEVPIGFRDEDIFDESTLTTTPPQSPRNETTPPPIIRSNQSLNPQEFRELFNRVETINRRASIISQTNLLAGLFEEFNPSHPDD